jgi:hypothetical protein
MLYFLIEYLNWCCCINGYFELNRYFVNFLVPNLRSAPDVWPSTSSHSVSHEANGRGE